MKRRIFSVFAMIVLLWALCVTVYAHEVPDLGRKGSISITMHHYGVPVPGGTMTLFRVGEVCEEDGNYSFRLTGDFLECDVSLDSIQSSELPEILAGFVEDNKLEGRTEEINGEAVARFDDLELGLYLLIQYEAAEGYYATKPFVVSVPGKEDGHYIYDVDASPKVDPVTAKPTEPPTEPPATSPGDSKLPQTGQLNWPVPLLVVSGLAVFALGWFLRFDRKKDN